MIYSQTRTQVGTAMPLLMGCTRPSHIETMEDDIRIIYDPMTQRSKMNMSRPVGTYSLRARNTRVNDKTSIGYHNISDKKNEIDDTKYVK